MRLAKTKTPQRIRGEMRGKGQITIPTAVRRAAHLSEGDLVEIEVTEDGILLRPLKTIDATQAWFWTEEWQAGEKEASEDVKAKRVSRYKSDEDFLSALKKK